MRYPRINQAGPTWNMITTISQLKCNLSAVEHSNPTWGNRHRISQSKLKQMRRVNKQYNLTSMLVQHSNFKSKAKNKKLISMKNSNLLWVPQSVARNPETKPHKLRKWYSHQNALSNKTYNMKNQMRRMLFQQNKNLKWREKISMKCGNLVSTSKNLWMPNQSPMEREAKGTN